MMRTRLLLATCGLAVIMTAAILSRGIVSRAHTDNAIRSEPIEWGVYQILWSRAYPEHLKKELSRFSTNPHYVMFYRDMHRPFPKFAIDAVAKHGATTVVSLELWSWHGGRKDSYLEPIIGGRHDDYFRAWADDARAYGNRVLLRFGFEFNGDWFSWSLDPKAYVAAWRHAYHIFQEHGATNVEWVWAPNVVSCPNTPENDMHLYYPGDEFVDWVGVDGYNFGENHDQWHTWQSFGDVFDVVLNDFAKRYKKKPVMIAEFGCAPGPAHDRAEWIRDAFRNLHNRPQIRAVVWFNYDKRREREPNFRIDATAGALDAFNKTFAAPR